MWSYQAHDLRLDAAFELQGFHAVPAQVPDLSLAVGEGPRADALVGEVLLEFGDGGPGSVSIVASAAGWVIRYPGFADFSLSRDRSTMIAVCAPDFGAKWLEVLAIGNPLAFLIALQGDVALHASAVQVQGCAFAFVGPSGLGKSTLACSLATVLGAAVISDDLLRISRDPRPLCYRGAVELRLREGNASDEVAGSAPRRRTVDGRIAVRHPSVAVEAMPLTAVVLPQPTRESDRPTLQRLTPADALFELLGQTRLVGWRDPEMLRRQFEGVADLVDRVPVFVAQVPWAQFGSDCLGELVELLISSTDRSSSP